MRLKPGFARIATVLVLSAAVLAVTACTSGPPTGPVASGVTRGALGGMEVVGFLSGASAGSDTWTVTDIKLGPSSAVQPKTLATLRPGEVDAGGIAALEGRYIWAAGRSWGGSEQVPGILVDGIDVAQEP